MGDSTRGFGKRQPGGWIFSILPFMEQQSVYQLGADAAGRTVMVGTPLGMLNCPSRRASVAYPLASSYVPTTTNYTCPANIAKSDYAACAGTSYNDFPSPYDIGPGSLAEGDGATWWANLATTIQSDWGADINSTYNGVIFGHSELTTAQVTDGTSCTLLLGEKYINPDFYATSQVSGDKANMYRGFTEDASRTAGYRYWPAIQDQEGNAYYAAAFGSAHASSWNTCFCDGSVRALGYTIDYTVFDHLGSRNDGSVIDGSAF